MRRAKLKRKTNETDIKIELALDGTGQNNIKTEIGFLTHMLESFSKHSAFDIKLELKGDIEVDQHHSVEDCGIALGEAIRKALGDKKGINRAGYFVYPMDESLAVIAVDLSGRPYLVFDAKFKKEKIGDLDSDLIEDFFQGFAAGCMANIHVKMPYGRSDHHKTEAIFKAFAKAMKMACSLDPKIKGQLPTTKGVL